MSGVLEGIRVIEMGQVEAGPITTLWMADWGAEVIKVEPPSKEMFRGTKRDPNASTKKPSEYGDMRLTFQLINRNKKGLAVDLKQETGRDIIHKLVQRADVFVSNYQLSALKKLKMDYATLSQLNPGLIYAVVIAYGAEGPDKDLGGYDFAAGWSRSGWQDLTREPDSPPPRLPGGAIDRSIAAPHALAGILAALLHRERTGKGQELEVSLFQSSVWTIALPIQSALLGTTVRLDRKKAQNPMNNIYRTKDNRWFEISMVSPDRY